MDSFLKWFNSDGSLIFKVEAYFDNEDHVDPAVCEVLDYFMTELPSDSDAVAIYYAGIYEGSTSALVMFNTWRGM